MPSNQPEGAHTLLLMSGASQPGRPGAVKRRCDRVASPHDAASAPAHAVARAGPAAADSHAGSESAAAGPEPAADLTPVESVEQTPTEAIDYAALSALYGLLLAG